MFKKFAIFMICSLLVISCGRKGDPKYEALQDIKIESSKWNTLTIIFMSRKKVLKA